MAQKKSAFLQPELANALKKRMEDVNLSTISIAELLSKQEGCRVTQSTVSQILNMKHGCSIQRLSNFDKILRKYENEKKSVVNRVLANG